MTMPNGEKYNFAVLDAFSFFTLFLSTPLSLSLLFYSHCFL